MVDKSFIDDLISIDLHRDFLTKIYICNYSVDTVRVRQGEQIGKK